MSGPPAALTEKQKLQQQFQLFQESLPKVNQLALTLLLNETIPLSMAVQKRLNESELSKMENDDELQINDIDLKDKLYITPKLDLPSHKLIQEISKCNEEDKLKVIERLRNIGFQIGNKMSELLVFTNNPNLEFKDMDLLLIMKFICRDVWKQLYGKQIDNLKTNHRGTFYLFDYDYKPIQPFSIEGDNSDEKTQEKELELVKPFLEIPVGIINGVLSSLGYNKEDVSCEATFVDRPDEKSKAAFPKGISFHVQILNQ
ncbi:hypothetical protein Kpol_1072p57 [Vanderwaltozyma polyspora DSM 70294]|uniref:Trafficking protein particle complex subunit 33 n=1 Tax=Vanderwaltozyma polyspora (strain ATCC 22028 / DSM 70294 / BCRC 21397 / CBS 2163 / NBRC 10782 / NRRL Y-8283 / UCD 57-17) TaxID=436907 RepID=A7TKS5_VANPO|nr:uncharacterized protein Kpol_1072p57 [Vanderwaltozyma polyspora DSM 70294]EDO17187.1 hypothetical protein Kpol_1072p57 [Vanderwaltozyma polyspora DSM 70294]